MPEEGARPGSGEKRDHGGGPSRGPFGALRRAGRVLAPAAAPRAVDDPALAIGGWSAEFLSPAAERAYRRYAWPETARAVRVAVFALVALIWVFVYSDYLFVGWTPLLALLLGVRLFTTILCGWILVETRHYRGRVAVERLLPWWLAAGAVLTLVIAATRPGNYLFQATLMVVEVFGIYIFTPMALRTVMALCSLACASFVAMMVARGGLEPADPDPGHVLRPGEFPGLCDRPAPAPPEAGRFRQPPGRAPRPAAA